MLEVGHNDRLKLGLNDQRKLGLSDQRKLGLNDQRKIGHKDQRKLGRNDQLKLGHNDPLKLGHNDPRKVGTRTRWRWIAVTRWSWDAMNSPQLWERRWEGGRKWHTGETDFTVVYMLMPHGTQGPQDIHILIVYTADIANCITFYFFQIKIYSHSPARVTPPLIVTPGLLSLPQTRTSISSTAIMFGIAQTLSVFNFEQ